MAYLVYGKYIKRIIYNWRTEYDSTRRAELFDMIEDFEHSARIVQLIGNKLKDAVSNGNPLNTGDYDVLIKNLSSKLKNIIITNNKRLNL